MNGAADGSLGLIKLIEQADALSISVLIVLTLIRDSPPLRPPRHGQRN